MHFWVTPGIQGRCIRSPPLPLLPLLRRHLVGRRTSQNALERRVGSLHQLGERLARRSRDEISERSPDAAAALALREPQERVGHGDHMKVRAEDEVAEGQDVGQRAMAAGHRQGRTTRETKRGRRSVVSIAAGETIGKAGILRPTALPQPDRRHRHDHREKALEYLGGNDVRQPRPGPSPEE